MTNVKTNPTTIARNGILKINDKIDFNQIINCLQSFKFTDDDLKDEHEKLSCFIFIVSMFKLSIFNFPISIYWKESPDFRFIFSKEKVGVEHVRATLLEFKMAERELKKRPDAYLEPYIYSPFEKLPKKEAFAGIRNKGECPKGKGWQGDVMELEWAKIMMSAIIEKTDLLNNTHFIKLEKNELLIEDDSPVGKFKDLDEGLKYLIKQFNNSSFEKKITFDKIHIFSVNENSAPIFIYDVFNKHLVIDVSKKNLKN